jgi:hypothetical protein
VFDQELAPARIIRETVESWKLRRLKG